MLFKQRGAVAYLRELNEALNDRVFYLRIRLWLDDRNNVLSTCTAGA